ncbi:Uncharacterised protein [Mycobacteroides abscessus subsp. abscessus]|nr:Uncharacterised protein [Mycobacteroides abscessus subsp. abscessus]
MTEFSLPAATAASSPTSSRPSSPRRTFASVRVGCPARSVSCRVRGATMRAVRTPGILDNCAKVTPLPCTWATWVSPLRIESANTVGAPARRKRISSGTAWVAQYRSLRASRISSRCGSMVSTRKRPPEAGIDLTSPEANPPGMSFTMCAGSRSLNSSRHAGYLWSKVTTTRLPPSRDCTSVMFP